MHFSSCQYFIKEILTCHFSEKLKTLRTQKQVRQKDIAAAMGVSLRAYQYYETDTKEPTMSNLIALADYFDVSIDYLVGRTDNPTFHKS